MSQQHGTSTPNGRSYEGRTVDWAGYPALFQRVAPTVKSGSRLPQPEPVVEPTPPAGRIGGIREAFLGFCQATLFQTGIPYRAESIGARRALAAAEAFGFTREEIRRNGFGLYVGPAALREDLRGVGFTDGEIDAARIVCDETGRLRSELTDCLVLPLTDETGRLCDFLFLSVAESGRGFSGYRYLDGSARSTAAAYGLQHALSSSAGARSLVMVEEVLDAVLLQCRGLHNVVAVGGPGHEMTPRRWEDLARLGVSSVTLAFRRDERHATSVRDALVGALRARTAPEIYAANPYPGGERSVADVLRRFGKDACGVAIEARSLAFHDKDFGAGRVRPAEPTLAPFAPAFLHEAVSVPAEPHFRTAFRKHLADLVAVLPPEDRAAAGEMVDAVELAMSAGDYARAAWLIDGRTPRPVTTRPEWFWSTWAGGYAFPRPRAEASVSSAAEICERIARSPEPAEVPAHLAGYAGRETPSAVEWVIDPSPRGRLATLCERIADACERRPGQAFVVVCCEHTERQVLLALATHLASRFSEGKGLTLEEVRARLGGVEPAGGYRDKPWLADEAADRLRLWSSRLTFVSCPPTASGRDVLEPAIESIRSRAAIGGVYFDNVPAARNYLGDPTGALWLGDLAARYGVPVVAAAPGIPAAWPAVWAQPVAPVVPTVATPAALEDSHDGRTVVATLRDWLRREREFAG